MNFWSLSRCFQEHGQYVWIEIHPNHSTSVKQTLTNGPPKLDTRESTACLIYCTWKTIAISVHRSRSSRGRPAFFRTRHISLITTASPICAFSSTTHTPARPTTQNHSCNPVTSSILHVRHIPLYDPLRVTPTAFALVQATTRSCELALDCGRRGFVQMCVWGVRWLVGPVGAAWMTEKS